ncbi:hypothetical protein M5362_32025 [Streptomyces sp. Je 1-79]|uniref:hypothetical protein n=1 Tax=Streptomyces sp. Je 1-79 TaxID=2943847 RepID=UPI0021A7B0B7|nr:hypothetical protein [Streptomyces sp. Je 1-79]MCT4357735.1 hypothetical protein [Streptomyces sp. Je 1-79]
MPSIETLIPQAGRADTTGLLEVDARVLARYVADARHPWWRRRPCVIALTGRVPERYVPELTARVRDPRDTAEVRTALLDLLADRPELLPWLRHEDRRGDTSYGMAEAFLKARGLLGDRSAARELATLAASPWPRVRAAGEAGLDGLVDRWGTASVLADLGTARPEDRIFQLRMRYRADEDVTDALADPDRGVAYLAQSLATDADRLRHCIDEAPTVEARLWAAYALHGLTEDTAETREVYERLGRPRVEVEGLDEELRAAIVHAYGPGCAHRSDPRWRVEALCTEPPARPDMDDRLRRATSALTAAGLAPKPPVSCGEDNQQGDGTYYVIEAGGSRLLISTLGPFATGEDDGCAARGALESAGFRWIDAETGAIRVTDLCVYYFGAREPLTVETLLFYWQD